MDGNGRWATARGLPRVAGHRQGAKAVRRTVEAAVRLGIPTLTLYAFSADNWRRPHVEVAALMRLFRAYLITETQNCVEHGVRFQLLGRRDRLPENLLRTAEALEEQTAGCGRLRLRIAIDYSARDAILRAARRLGRNEEPSIEQFLRLLGEVDHDFEPAPAVDLLIRTGGEQRLSDFLLWESAYAELYFTPRMWPDFEAADLDAALAVFGARERRFGRLNDSSGLPLTTRGPAVVHPFAGSAV
jgi:undecaprenyl diphosphate synthase